MNCDKAQEGIVLAQYGELPDDLLIELEQHLGSCSACQGEWEVFEGIRGTFAALPVHEPSPNLLAASRMRLDEALDAMPPRSLRQRFFGNTVRWMGFLRGAPALTTLLLGMGFLGGDLAARYEAAHAPQLPRPVILSSAGKGAIASVSGIEQTPNSELVQVKYNRLVPETVQGSLDDPQIRELLMLGTKLATSKDVHADSVSLLASECRAGHACEGDGTASDGVRAALLVSLRRDGNPQVRLKALEGLQPFVAQDERVRDAVLDALMRDGSPAVRTAAIAMLEPVGADSSVRQVLRTVSLQDVNPAIRTASFQALQGTSDIE